MGRSAVLGSRTAYDTRSFRSIFTVFRFIIFTRQFTVHVEEIHWKFHWHTWTGVLQNNPGDLLGNVARQFLVVVVMLQTWILDVPSMFHMNYHLTFGFMKNFALIGGSVSGELSSAQLINWWLVKYTTINGSFEYVRVIRKRWEINPCKNGKLAGTTQYYFRTSGKVKITSIDPFAENTKETVPVNGLIWLLRVFCSFWVEVEVSLYRPNRISLRL